jgi:hypothetical protein
MMWNTRPRYYYGIKAQAAACLTFFMADFGRGKYADGKHCPAEGSITRKSL